MVLVRRLGSATGGPASIAFGLSWIGLLMVVLLAGPSCGGPAGPEVGVTPAREAVTPTPTPINPQAVLEQSGAAMTTIRSFRFRLEHNTYGTPMAQNLILMSVKGHVIKPDKLSLEFVGSLGNFAMRGNVITIGDQTFMTNPLNDEWQVLRDQVSPLAFFDPAQGISAMMSQVTEPVVLDLHRNEVHIGGRLPASALSPLFGQTSDGVIDVELTISLQDSYLTEVVLDGRITEAEPEGVVRTIVLDQFNDPTVIEPPL